jgi:(p)ppGpp synthase/HD superfamily hydrolase
MHLTTRFDDAVQYASIVHGGQTRKSTSIPYFAHVLSVTALVLDHGGDEEQAIAALLHDAAEDVGGQARLDHIRAHFGDRVADIVDVCSDTFENPKPPWKERKEAFLARLPNAPKDALLVVAADKLHNVGSILRDYQLIGEELWDRFRAGRDGQLWYYGEVVPVLQELIPGPLVDELAHTVRRLRDAAGSA